MSRALLPEDRLCCWTIYAYGVRVGCYIPHMDLDPLQIQIGDAQLGTTGWQGLIFARGTKAFPQVTFIYSFHNARLTLRNESEGITFRRELKDLSFLRGLTEDWKNVTVKPSFYPMPELDLSHNHLYTGEPCRCHSGKFPCPTFDRAAHRAIFSFS